ncbi:hypothetical protein HanPSC8_Chr08g0309821 [Helianthus annuus]|nr:hypothetical protein HanPSC8_Chr08g0309821 [Helianthus annuus]
MEEPLQNIRGKISSELNHGEKLWKRQATYLDGSSMKTAMKQNASVTLLVQFLLGFLHYLQTIIMT